VRQTVTLAILFHANDGAALGFELVAFGEHDALGPEDGRAPHPIVARRDFFEALPVGIQIERVVHHRDEYVIVVGAHHHVFPAETAGGATADDFCALQRHGPENFRLILYGGHGDVADIGLRHRDHRIPAVHFHEAIEHVVDACRKLLS